MSFLYKNIPSDDFDRVFDEGVAALTAEICSGFEKDSGFQLDFLDDEKILFFWVQWGLLSAVKAHPNYQTLLTYVKEVGWNLQTHSAQFQGTELLRPVVHFQNLDDGTVNIDVSHPLTGVFSKPQEPYAC